MAWGVSVHPPLEVRDNGSIPRYFYTIRWRSHGRATADPAATGEHAALNLAC